MTDTLPLFNELGSILGLTEHQQGETKVNNEFSDTFGRKPMHPYEAADFFQEDDVADYLSGVEEYMTEALVASNEEKPVDHINPSHYKMIPPEAYERFPNGIEYFDLMTFVLAHHDPVHAHAIGQSLKYLLRAGKKDALKQDLKKARWYLDYLIEEMLED